MKILNFLLTWFITPKFEFKWKHDCYLSLLLTLFSMWMNLLVYIFRSMPVLGIKINIKEFWLLTECNGIFVVFQSRQPVFVKLLQGAFRVSDCPWLTGTQKYHVETCIKCLADIGKVVQGLIKGLSNLSFVLF